MKTILIASGASGGHLFPALAVAEAMRAKGWRCVVVLGGGRFAHEVEARGLELVRLPASAFNDRNPLLKLWALVKVAMGVGVALRLVLCARPAVVFGTGGYATVATMLAAKLVGVPTVVHEQNVLPGRANRFLAKVVDKLLLTFVGSRAHLPKGLVTEWTGTPLRQQVTDVVGMKLPDAKKPFGVMVLGGSMGARILSTVVPEMVKLLPASARKTLHVVHQARAEDVARVRAAYDALGVKAVVESFFSDLPARYKDVHVVIGRSGTGTILETAVLGRAGIYCPHQLADNHQLLNAQVAVDAGAAVLLEQPDFTPDNLLREVQALMANRVTVAVMGKAAQKLVVRDATGKVVRALEQAADDDIMPAFAKAMAGQKDN